MSTQSILVTGGAGYIGSHTCKMLAAKGYSPVTLDNLSTGHRDNVQWGPLIKADVRDAAAVATVLRAHNIQAVMHFAASAYVGESVRKPAMYYDNNVKGIMGLLEACRETAVHKVIFSSSCATYGIPTDLPITESTTQRPINPYGHTKLMGEQILKDYAQAYGMHYVILRYFNACGADPDGQLREIHDPETHLIPLALMAANGLLSQLEVFGSDYATKDGTCVRDYVHVCDLAQGHIGALEHLLNGRENLAVNLGSGVGHSIKDILLAIEQVTGRAVPVKMGERRAGDPPVLFADASLAKERLGFAPKYSDLATIIRHAAPTFGVEVRDAICA